MIEMVFQFYLLAPCTNEINFSTLIRENTYFLEYMPTWNKLISCLDVGGKGNLNANEHWVLNRRQL